MRARILWILHLGLLAVVGCGSNDSARTMASSDRLESTADSSAKEPLVRWTVPLDLAKLGMPSNPKVDGKTLQQIVSSVLAGRDDGKLCSDCHNRSAAAGGYGVPVESGKSSSPILSIQLQLDGHRWAGPGGWAERFIANPTKPEGVKNLLKAWKDSGFQE